MNRVTLIFLSAVSCLSIAACGKRDKSSDPVSALVVEQAARRELHKRPHRHYEDEITAEDRQSVTYMQVFGVSDLASITNYPQLETLWLLGCPGLTDLTPLSELPALRNLYLTGCNSVSDLRPLYKHPKLTYIVLEGCPGIREVPKPLMAKAQILWRLAIGVTPSPTPGSLPAT